MATSDKKVQYTKWGLKMVGTKSIFDLDEPPWLPDEKVRRCLNCNEEFTTLLRRKHHCRRCGQVFCGTCVSKLPVYRMGFVDPQCVCKKCEATCKAEEDFYEHHLKVLCKGAKFCLSDSKDPEQAYECCLSPDHLDILISDHEPVSIKSILKIRMITGDSSQPQDSPALGFNKKSGSLKNINGMHIQFSFGQEEKAMMLICCANSKKQSADWLRALKKALMLLRE
ncbi:zinc finger FYVE domain-containing protein 21-like [Dysidea avara]|uniref:zinc finger FYVE domain-containing protein 21-like n=1 Tax=Dysidea avara TaxID=196820 RepID=UPI00332CCEF8